MEVVREQEQIKAGVVVKQPKKKVKERNNYF